jgi:hypothetical protein
MDEKGEEEWVETECGVKLIRKLREKTQQSLCV